MLAARDQENLVHAHQQAAAGKPLNQSIRQLQPKTPGNKAPKTPFRIPLNDENAAHPFPGQKTTLKNIGKDNENIIQTSKKDGKLDKNAFVTPMGPRTRAPLGMKTTNAKAKALETPALTQTKPLQTVKRPSTARTKKKSKITIAQPEPTQTDVLSKELEDDDVPDIEYMPPKPVELADPPEEIPYDDTFPQFQGRNMFKGWAQLYGPPIGPDGLTDSQRELERQYDKLGEEWHKEVDAQINAIPSHPEIEADREVERILRTHFSKKAKDVDTVKARGAASALSKQPSQLSKPTIASQQRAKMPSKLLPTSKKPTPQPTNPSSMRHTALAAASRNTVGYSKGRNVSSKLPNVTSPAKGTAARGKQLDEEQYDMSPQQFKSLFGEPPEGSDMWYRLHEDEIFPKPRYLVDDLDEDLDDLRLDDVVVEDAEDNDDFELKWT